MAGIENGDEYEYTVALLRSCGFSAEDQDWLRWILQWKMYSKDRTSHTEMNEALSKGIEVTAGKIRKWKQCDVCMRERNLDIDETSLRVARETAHNINTSEKNCTEQEQKN